MAGISDLERNISRLEQATEAAEEATRSAHAARKDLDRLLREVRAVLTTEVKAAVGAAIRPVVQTGLDEMGAEIRKATSDCYDRVGHQVDMLVNLMLGRPGTIGRRHEDLRPALAEKLRQWINDELAKV